MGYNTQLETQSLEQTKPQKPQSKSRVFLARKKWLVIGVVVGVVVLSICIATPFILSLIKNSNHIKVATNATQIDNTPPVRTAENIRDDTARGFLTDGDPLSAIAVFQKSIDSYSNKEDKAKAYIALASMLYEYYPAGYKDQILSYAYKAEEISPTAYTAAFMVDIESKYGNTVAVQKYQAIYLERSKNTSGGGS